MLSIIIPTLGNRIFELERLLISLKNQTSKEFEVILVAQGNNSEIESLLKGFDMRIKICHLEKKGLSYARNRAIDLVSKTSTYLSFSDDDCWYPDNAIEYALMNLQQTGGCCCFQIYDPIKKDYYKKYNPEIIEKVNLRQSLKISSIEIFIPKTIIDSGIRFDERFGLGTPYPSGEENIFLFDIIKKGFNISYIPNIIVFHPIPDWKNKEYIFKGKGALFARLFNKGISPFLILIYAIQKREFSDNWFLDLRKMFFELFTFRK